MNKITKRLISLVLAVSFLTSSVFASTYTADTVDEFYQVLAEAWSNQEEEFTITYSKRAETLVLAYFSLAQIQRQLSALSTDEENYDFLALNLDDGQITIDENDFSFTGMKYLDNLEELEYVKTAVEEIVDSLDLEDADDFVKIKTIYEYMTSNFVYDHTLSIFSAYDGLQDNVMVCQAYSLLTCYLLEEAGINARIVTGLSQNQNHAWNQVEWNGEWYNLDTTWDGTDEIGQPGTWAFFMKNTADFTGHTPFDVFLTEDYLSEHPIAKESYPLETIDITSVTGEYVTGLTIRTGIPVTLNYILPDGTTEGAENLYWSSDDTDVLTVTQDGQVTGVSIGTTWLNLESLDNPDWIGDKLSVTVVDMSSLSDWAYDIITDYYLAQMIPSNQCYDFTSSITRADLARIADQLIYQTVGYGNLSSAINEFTDIDDLEYYDFIAVLRLDAIGVMSGSGDGLFNPYDTLTREEAAAVLVRVQEYINGQSTVNTNEVNFTDSDQISSWAVDVVTIAQTQGLLQGNADGSFKPQDSMTREQMIVALSRIYEQFIQ